MFRIPLILCALTLAALALRATSLGGTFASSDDAELAHRIILHDGWAWMIAEHYGVLISLLVKLHAVLIAALGIPMTEFWWRLPVAVAGTALVPATFWAMRALGGSPRAAIWAAAFAAVFPIHVFHSRYLWGYEALGALFAVLALAALTKFFEHPTRRRGITTGCVCAAYLVSHGYIIPFFGVLLLLPLLFGREGEPHVGRRFLAGCKLYATQGVLVPILLAAPIYQYAIRHALEKRTAFGIHAWYYFLQVVQNVGVFLVLFASIACAVFVVAALTRVQWSAPRLPAQRRDRVILALIGAGVGYLLPIFVLTPPGITLTRNYLLLGPMFLVLAAIVIVDRSGGFRSRVTTAAATVVVLLTGWGTFESYYSMDRWTDPSLVRWERGVVQPEPGSKALGYLVRHAIAKDANVLFLHRRMEPPNVGYYVGFEHTTRAFYDRTLRRSRSDYSLSRTWADYVVADPKQGKFLDRDRGLTKLFVLHVDGDSVAIVYGKPGRTLDLTHVPGTGIEMHRRFDAEIGPVLSALVLQPLESRTVQYRPAAPAPR